ncbi:MAG: hypothetical protein L6R39_005837 [Caloplaca ligustica]|nr:MAG: hypothetical protein L6R39_005837 [Caloplaca ligustica]
MADKRPSSGMGLDDDGDYKPPSPKSGQGRKMLRRQSLQARLFNVKPTEAAQTRDSKGMITAAHDGTDPGFGGRTQTNLVPYYESSPEDTTGRSSRDRVFMQILAEAAEAGPAAVPDGSRALAHVEGNRDSGVDASIGPRHETPSVPAGTAPRLRLRTDEELTDYSEDEYEYEGSSSDADTDDGYGEEPPVRREKKRSTSATSAKPVKRDANAPKESKMEQRRLALAKKGIELDSNGIRKGQTRGSGNSLEYLQRNGNKWIPAVYHNDIREKLLRLSDAKGKYDEEPVSGVDPLDRTAYRAQQKHWRFHGDRKDRPGILFEWNQTVAPPGELPGFWYDENRIVLSFERRPMRRWAELPLTLSGQCEGMRLETFKRMNRNISVDEMRARMPNTTCMQGGLVKRRITTPALANRMARDRDRIFAKAWTARQGSLEIERRLFELIPEDVQRKIVRMNSTRCWRDLTKAELEYVEAANKGAPEHLAKAGTKRLDDEVRREREYQKAKRVMGKQGDEVKKHPVVEEALQTRPAIVPRTAQGHQATVSTNLPSLSKSALKGGNIVDLGQEDLEVGDISNPKRPGSPAAEAPFKRQKSTTTAEIDANKEQSNNTNVGSENTPLTIIAQVDFRLKRPSTVLEALVIQGALGLSREDYERHVGFSPGFTDRNESYAYQLAQLQAALRQQIGSKHAIPALKRWGPVRSFAELQAQVVALRKSSGSAGKADQGSNDRNMEGDTLVEESEQPVVPNKP